MALPGNGVFVVQGEMAMLVTAMRRSTRWGSHSFPGDEYDVLMRTFQDLKTILNQVEDLKLVDPATFLSPFLEVIRSKETTGPVTSLALQAINKFLSYGLIDPTHSSVPATVEDIADAVTHARFVGTDHSSDGIVLMRILQVLRTLMLSPEGAMLTDESVCEIMLSCFRICFESRLSELLRRHAEQCLRDMTQLIFMRLPQFTGEESEDKGASGSVGLSLRRRDKSGKRNCNSGIASSPSNKNTTEQSQQPSTNNVLDMQGNISHSILTSPTVDNQSENVTSEIELSPESTSETNSNQNRSPSKKHTRHSSMDLASTNHNGITQLLEKCVSGDSHEDAETDILLDTEIARPENDAEQLETQSTVTGEQSDPIEVQSNVEEGTEETLPLRELADDTASPKVSSSGVQEDYVNPRGIRFTAQEEDVSLQPYGVVCVKELFRFLISLCNPLDVQNTTAMVHLGLSLVGTALEVGADQLPHHASLLYLVKDPLSRNLLSLLNSEKITIFALDLQISFLLFESLRSHLKLQMESFFVKLIEIISADTSKSNYELKEITHITLESLGQIFRIPGICAELYLNYDCDIYCSNIFEDITKLLSKNVVSSTSYNVHSLSLDALMTVIESIENNCNQKKTALQAKSVNDSDESEGEEEGVEFRGGHVRLELGGLDDASVRSDPVRHISQYKLARHKPSSHLPTEEQLDEIKNRKRWIATGTEMFNQKAEKGIEFLQEHGILQTPLQPMQVAMFLRENPGMEKKMIGEYICKRSSASTEAASSVLSAFADSFEYAGLRIDQALRLYLETFRLPGEAPLIFLVMEHFAERWHLCNGSPFANTDAAFRLAYAIIMLNMDQHNHNAKKLNVPMTPDDFVRNLRGCNGSGDFDQAMLLAVFNAIKNEEIVMPAERSGIVRDNYLWKVLLRRGLGTGGHYLIPPPDLYDDRLFALVWGPTVSALSSAFERAPAPTPEELEGGSVHVRACRALLGLEQCAAIVAQQHHSGRGRAVTLDTLVLTMCKFTGLLSLPDNANYITIGVSLGQSTKSQLALRRACMVMSRHADCLRDAWGHLMDLLRALYRGQLIPESLAEAEDYMSPSGKVSLIRESALNRAPEPGLLSSLYSYIALSGEPAGGPSREERHVLQAAAACVDKCHLPSLLVTETKFMQLASLQEMVKHLIASSTPPEADLAQLNTDVEDNVIFFLELLSRTIIQNRDRVLHIWAEVSQHWGRLVHWAGTRASTAPASPYAAERVVTALLRSAVQLMRSEECAAAVLDTLNVLFELPYRVFYHQADRISWGLYELVKTSAQNVHSVEEWGVVFALLEAAGAGAWPRADDGCDTPNTASSRSDGALSSEDEGSASASAAASSDTDLSQSPATHGWIVINNTATGVGVSGVECESLAAPVCLRPHSSSALARCCECLALVVRDVAHITPYNFATCVRCVRTFVEASLHGGKKQSMSGVLGSADQRSIKRSKAGKQSSRTHTLSHAPSGDEDDEPEGYQMVSIKLLDLMHTLHSRTAQIFRWWREEAVLSTHYNRPHHADVDQGDEDCSELWEVAWMPLLQGIARLCTDRRKQVCTSGVACLQRALLAPGLQALQGQGWEACFARVLFPLLAHLQHERPRRVDLTARANTIMCKVFLHHLSALSPRPGFSSLWLRVVALQRALVAPARPAPSVHGPVATHADADALREAALESLKNMILVMDSVKVFSNGSDDNSTELWDVTWQQISEFLPHLREELFPQTVQEGNIQFHQKNNQGTPSISPPSSPPITATAATLQSHSRQLVYPQVAHPPGLLGEQQHVASETPHKSSSIILQPPTPTSQLHSPLFSHLGQMVSTPIGINIPAMQNQEITFPILYPNPTTVTTGIQPPTQNYRPDLPLPIQPSGFTLITPNYSDTSQIDIVTGNSAMLPNTPAVDTNRQSDSLYIDYLTDPYTQLKDLSTKEARLYEPAPITPSNTFNTNNNSRVQNAEELADFIVTSSPLPNVQSEALQHTESSRTNTDRQTDSSISTNSSTFNFASYFGGDYKSIPPGSEMLFGDAIHFMPTQEG